MRAGLRNHRNAWLIPTLVAVFIGSLPAAGWLWPFTLGLLLVVWGVRVVNEITFDAVPDSWVRDYGTPR